MTFSWILLIGADDKNCADYCASSTQDLFLVFLFFVFVFLLNKRDLSDNRHFCRPKISFFLHVKRHICVYCLCYVFTPFASRSWHVVRSVCIGSNTYFTIYVEATIWQIMVVQLIDYGCFKNQFYKLVTSRIMANEMVEVNFIPFQMAQTASLYTFPIKN